MYSRMQGRSHPFDFNLHKDEERRKRACRRRIRQMASKATSKSCATSVRTAATGATLGRVVPAPSFRARAAPVCPNSASPQSGAVPKWRGPPACGRRKVTIDDVQFLHISYFQSPAWCARGNDIHKVEKLLLCKKVKSIAYDLFSPFDKYAFKSLVFGDSVREIGAYAFSCPTVSSVSISNSVTDIGPGAFRGTGLSSVVVPAGCRVGDNAFPESCIVVVCGVLPKESWGDAVKFVDYVIRMDEKHDTRQRSWSG